MSERDTTDVDTNVRREFRFSSSEYSEKTVEATWKKMMTVAQNHINMGKLDENGRTVADTDVRNGFYQRERLMIAHLEALFSITHNSKGYLSFIGTLTRQLDSDNPVAMAFLSHVIERSALPDRDTLKETSVAILDKLNKKPGRLQRVISLLSGSHRDTARKELVRKQITNHFVNNFMNPSVNPAQIKVKLNSAILWSLLADRFAGELSNYVYQDSVGTLLLDSLTNPQEELLVRVFSLLAIEKFTVTAQIKQRVESLGIDMRELLFSLISECDEATTRIHLLSFGEERPMCSLFTPPPGPLREEWAKYGQLKMCCQWALDHAFRDGPTVVCPWNLRRQRIIMNPYDSTAGMKFTNNGLELRNDRNHFESARGTACVRKGKWFYEAQLLSHGIIQIGWATNRCRFSPDEGFGVGDDCNGFAFDTFRSAVWADGVCVHPSGNRRVRCSVGDVVGSLLDLDNGSCTYYINGKDVGMTVEFENPKNTPKKARHKKPVPRSSPRISSRSTRTTSPPPRPQPNALSTELRAREEEAEESARVARRMAELEQQRLEDVEAAAVRAAHLKAESTTSGSSRTTTNNNTSSSSKTSSSTDSITSEHNIARSRSTVNRNSLAYDQRSRRRSASVSRVDSLSKKGLGLYPAISLTTNQHVRINFGDEPWMYRPPITFAYWGVNQAGELDDYFKNRVIHWANKRGKISHGKFFGPTNTQPLRPRYGADEIPEGQLNFSDSSEDEDGLNCEDSENEDGASKDLCNICYSEPANVILNPCKHGDIGGQCAGIITKCPLCRTIIQSREVRK